MRPLEVLVLAVWAVLVVIVGREVWLAWRSGKRAAPPKAEGPGGYRAAGTLDRDPEALPSEPVAPTVIAFTLLVPIAFVAAHPYAYFARLADKTLPVCGEPCPDAGGGLAWALMGAGSAALVLRLLPALAGCAAGLVVKKLRPASAMRDGRMLLAYAGAVVLLVAACVGVRVARGGVEPEAFTELGGLTARGATRAAVEQAIARRGDRSRPLAEIAPTTIAAERLPTRFPPFPASLCCRFGDFRDGREHPDWGVRVVIGGKPHLFLAENDRVTYWRVPELPPGDLAGFESPLVARFEAMPGYLRTPYGFIVIEDKPGWPAPHALYISAESGSQQNAAARPGDMNPWPLSAIEVAAELAIPPRTQSHVAIAIALAVLAVAGAARLARRRLAWSGTARVIGAWLALELSTFAFTQVVSYL